ncbi:hypothetical protein GCM10025786_18480 [Nocardioides caeni]
MAVSRVSDSVGAATAAGVLPTTSQAATASIKASNGLKRTATVLLQSPPPRVQWIPGTLTRDPGRTALLAGNFAHGGGGACAAGEGTSRRGGAGARRTIEG